MGFWRSGVHRLGERSDKRCSPGALKGRCRVQCSWRGLMSAASIFFSSNPSLEKYPKQIQRQMAPALHCVHLRWHDYTPYPATIPGKLSGFQESHHRADDELIHKTGWLSVMAGLIISHKHYRSKSAELLQQGSSGLMKPAQRFLHFLKVCNYIHHPGADLWPERIAAVFWKCLQRVAALYPALHQHRTEAAVKTRGKTVAGIWNWEMKLSGPAGQSCVSNNTTLNPVNQNRLEMVGFGCWVSWINDFLFDSGAHRGRVDWQQCVALHKENLELFEWVCRCTALSGLFIPFFLISGKADINHHVIPAWQKNLKLNFCNTFLIIFKVGVFFITLNFVSKESNSQ